MTKFFRMIKNSIAGKIRLMLIDLTIIFTISTLINGFTNDRVKRAAIFMAESFVQVEYQQNHILQGIANIQLYEEQSKINEQSSLGDVKIYIQQTQMHLNQMQTLCDEIFEKTKNDSLKDAFLQYNNMLNEYLHMFGSIGLEQDALQNKYKEVIVASEEFQTILDEAIKNKTNSVLSNANLSTTVIIVTTIVFLITVLITLKAASQTISKPLQRSSRELTKIISTIEDGNGDLTLRLPVRCDDEIGRLSKGINRFIEALQRIMVHMKEDAVKINESSLDTKDKMEDCQNSTSSIASVMEELAASMEEMNASLDSMGKGAHKVSESAADIATDAQNNSNLVQEIVKRAEEMDTVTKQNLDQTVNMVHEIGQNMSVAIENSHSVNRIYELTKDILNLSSQTNLLSLNASIEAARAGEAGRGFLVVAEEIRELAENTRATASGIQDISSQVTSAVNELVKNAKEILEYIINHVVKDYEGFVEVVDSYKHDADSMNEMLAKFRKASDELEQIATDMDEGVQTINGVMNASTEAIANTAGDTTALLTSVTAIADVITENKEIADGLLEESNRFTKL